MQELLVAPAVEKTLGDNGFFQGRDRVAFSKEFGRLFRMGSIDALRVSTADRIRQMLQGKDSIGAREYLAYLHPQDMLMITFLSEWPGRWAGFLLRRLGAVNGNASIIMAFALWRSTLPVSLKSDDHEAALVLAKIYEPKPNSKADTFQYAAAAATLTGVPKNTYKLILEQIARNEFDLAQQTLNTYILQVRNRHDLLLRYLWSFPSVLNNTNGQAMAEEGLRDSFGACSFQESMWRIFESLAPVARAAFLAEHLRAHFSGANREGTVEIIEEADRYRLVFAPCGSGGAMRREGAGSWADGMTVFRDASPATWGRAGQVSAYCSHCAFNEIKSVKRMGFPLWVTEFNPDPEKPCGWTVFKDPKNIPDSYFERIGAARPEATGIQQDTQ